MNKPKIITKTIFEISIDMLSGIGLWFLIWGGAIIAWANEGELFLAVLLFLSGLAWAYKDIRRIKNLQKEVEKNNG